MHANSSYTRFPLLFITNPLVDCIDSNFKVLSKTSISLHLHSNYSHSSSHVVTWLYSSFLTDFSPSHPGSLSASPLSWRPHYLACPFNDVGSPRCTAAGDLLPLLPELIQTTLLLTCSPNTSTLILLLSSLASPLWLLILFGFRSQLSDFYKRSRASTSLTAMNQAHRSWKISSSVPVSEGYWTKLDRVGLAGHVPKPVRTQPDMVLMFLKARNLSAVKTTNFNEAK